MTSQYPVILSIENHCSVGQQTVMGLYMKNALGSLFLFFLFFFLTLCADPIFPKDLMVSGNPDVNKKALPSPNELKGKIIVKVRSTIILLDLFM